MSGTANIKPPRNNAEWARNTEKRLSDSENPTAQRAGDWVLSTNPDSGHLVASNVNGGSTVVAEKPAPSDNADEISTKSAPFIRIERQQNRNAARGTVDLVPWDTVAHQTPEWGFIPTGTDITVPQDGIYQCTYHLQFLNDSSVDCYAYFYIDGIIKMAQCVTQGFSTQVSMYMAEPFALNSGQIIHCGALVSGSGTMDYGASGTNTSVYTSLSLLKLPVS